MIKKAFILAQQVHEFASIADRVHTILFLATPHRGADMAALLSRILQVAHGERPFVQDLHRNSPAIQSINDEFSHHCQHLQLFSFYETLPTNYVVGKGLVVDKDLAILNYTNERAVYMHANHRDICKYADTSDPNYQTVRNALASVTEGFRIGVFVSQNDVDAGQQDEMESYLGLSDTIEDDFLDVDSQRLSGSCEWLMEKQSFQRWRDSSSQSQIYWISAKPASGKTVLSGYVIKHLREAKHDCAFYFFRCGDKIKATISSWLRSMAWQLAIQHPEILTTILETCRKDPSIAKADYRTIWRKLYLDGILKVKLHRPQYWVIDALDECKSDVELIPLLVKLSETLNVRFVVTCRNKHETYGQMLSAKTGVISEEISEIDTKADITKFLNANIDFLPAVDEGGYQSIFTQILRKSNGCFLWVKLVLEELRQVHTSAEVYQVLDEVPSDMDELYTRILSSMSKAPYGKLLAKAILTWTVCSARPLTTEELYFALQLDIKDTINKIEKAITASCGQLVYIDSKSRVHMVHQTARDFLLHLHVDSEFAIDKKSGHRQLLMTCLQYLCSNEMKGPRQRKLSVKTSAGPRCAFVSYACSALHEHIRHVSSTDDDVFLTIAKFLSAPNILSWIEYLAQVPDLTRIIQAGRSLRNYLQRRSRYVSPFGKDVATLDSWATDLVRLVAKFGKMLLSSPSSIYHLIPPFCPAESALFMQFAASPRGIRVQGLSTTAWDDCLSTVVRPGEHLTALASCDDYFAVGSSNGKLAVYHEMTCQETQQLQHGESVRTLQFGQTRNLLAASGMKTIRLWDIDTWQQLWQKEIARDCLSLCFTDEDRLLIGALRSNQLMVWDCEDGSVNGSADWTEDEEGQLNHAYRRPISASICPISNLLAVVYRGHDILVWDIESNTTYDTYGKEAGAKHNGTVATDVKAFVTGGLVFSSDPSAILLAASYSDGDLVVFDIAEGTVKERTLANAQILASSSNGRTLATADGTGRIQIFDFETLWLLHCISADDYGIKALAFNGDNSRLLDIRGSECRVWDPSALLRPDEIDENSDTVSVITLAQETTLESFDEKALITAIACHGNGEVIFCGKSDGGIYFYNSDTGSEGPRLVSHATNASIVSLYYDGQSSFLISADHSSRVMGHALVMDGKGWIAQKPSFDRRIGSAIDRILSSSGATDLLVSSGDKDVLYSAFRDGSHSLRCTEMVEPKPHRWANFPSNPDLLVLMTHERMELYAWKTLQRVSDSDDTLAQHNKFSQLSIQSLRPCVEGRYLAATFIKRSATRVQSKKILVSRTNQLSLQSASRKLSISSQVLADDVQLLIGSYGQRLIFLHSNGWVCSTDLESLDIERQIRHFFIPLDWLNSGTNLMMDITCNGDIVFVKRHEIAVIKRGLEANEQGPSVSGARSPSRGSQRPSLIPSRSSASDDAFLKPYSKLKRPSLPVGMMRAPSESII